MRPRRLGSGEGYDLNPTMVLAHGAGGFGLQQHSLRLCRILGLPGGMRDAFSTSVKAA